MHILITGCHGQLGNEMQVLAPQHTSHQYFFTDIDELDITSKTAVQDFVQAKQIDLIVNCAAFTNVDKAESNEDLAEKINAQAVENLAASGAKVIHISTDYVFDGEAFIPYKESDEVHPVSAYGRTKRHGEEALLRAGDKGIIIRTAWLYSSFGNNFVKTMLRLGQEREQLNVVYDQIGTPTYAADLATAIFAVIECPEWHAGIYHFTNEGVCSWYDFTKMIHQMAGIQCEVSPILSQDYPTPTRRPHYSVLDKAKIKSTFNLTIPHWTDGLARCLQKL